MSNISEDLFLATGVAYEAEPFDQAAAVKHPETADFDQEPSLFEQDHLAMLNRLLTAAAINSKFCQRLLTNPRAAIAAGYRDETFAFSDAEIALFSAIRAETLTEFAQAVAEQQRRWG